MTTPCCREGWSTHLEKLLDYLQLSDVTFNVGGRELPAHNLILTTRSKIFVAMFKHPTKKKIYESITIEDIEPEVFPWTVSLHLHGTGDVRQLESMAVGL